MPISLPSSTLSLFCGFSLCPWSLLDLCTTGLVSEMLKCWVRPWRQGRLQVWAHTCTHVHTHTHTHIQALLREWSVPWSQLDSILLNPLASKSTERSSSFSQFPPRPGREPALGHVSRISCLGCIREDTQWGCGHRASLWEPQGKTPHGSLSCKSR